MNKPTISPGEHNTITPKQARCVTEASMALGIKTFSVLTDLFLNKADHRSESFWCFDRRFLILADHEAGEVRIVRADH